MIAPAFGFSVEDFIAGLHIAKEAVEALSEANGATYEYTLAITWLKCLEFVLRQVQALQAASLSSPTVKKVHELAHACTIPVARFLRKVEPYEEYLQSRVETTSNFLDCVPFFFRQTSYKVKWALITMKNLEELKRQILPYLNEIMLCLQFLSLEHDEDAHKRARNVERLVEDQSTRLTDLAEIMRALQDAFQQSTLDTSRPLQRTPDNYLYLHLARPDCSEPHFFSVRLPFEFFCDWCTLKSHLLHRFSGIKGIDTLGDGAATVYEYEHSAGEVGHPRPIGEQRGWAQWIVPGITLLLTHFLGGRMQIFVRHPLSGPIKSVVMCTGLSPWRNGKLRKPSCYMLGLLSGVEQGARSGDDSTEYSHRERDQNQDEEDLYDSNPSDDLYESSSSGSSTA